MNITFEQLIMLISTITTNAILIIAAIKAKGKFNALEEKATSIEKNTNNTLTMLQQKLDAALEALKQIELLRMQEQLARESMQSNKDTIAAVANAAVQAAIPVVTGTTLVEPIKVPLPPED